jgi:hypothetical protein
VIFVELRYVFYTRHMSRNDEKISMTCSRVQQDNEFVPTRGFVQPWPKWAAGPDTCMKREECSMQPQLVED